MNALGSVVALAARPSLDRCRSCSVVASREEWLNSAPDRVPALVLGLITRVATRQLTSEALVAQCSPLAYRRLRLRPR